MANERTYLSWTTQATNLCVFGVGLAGYGEVNHIMWVQAVGLSMLPVGVAALCWALRWVKLMNFVFKNEELCAHKRGIVY